MSGGYPTSDEYNIAVQIPASFTDRELKAATVKKNNIGYPVALGGGFALTYEMTAGKKRMAVRCFHKQTTGLEAKYSLIGQHLASASGPFVKFEFQPRGIRVNGRPFPLVKMDWADGEPLGSYLETAHEDRVALGGLLAGFRDLSRFLANRRMAHGDLQNGNVLIRPDGLTLIDYDGMYVPGMAAGQGSELGQLHFQHPRRSADDFGPAMDRFSLIVIDISLRALMERPRLFGKHSSGENILLSAADYRAPSQSEAFADLRAIPPIATDVDRLAALCAAPLSAVPSLEEFLAGRGVSAAPPFRTSNKPGEASSRPILYIGAYPVIDGADFAAVVGAIGDKVELVARIEEVHKAETKHGQPYVFLNFGHWRENIAKVSIWSTTLRKLSSPPDHSWQGKWISVTGLVDPVWEDKRRGHRHVSITVEGSSQIRAITEAEAKRRLASRFASPVQTASAVQEPPPQSLGAPSISAQPRSCNSKIVRGIPHPTPAHPVPSLPAAAQHPTHAAAGGTSRNRAIVEGLKQPQGRTVTPALSTRPAPSTASPNPSIWRYPPPQDHPTPSPLSPASSHQAPSSGQGRGMLDGLGRLLKGLLGR